MANSWYVSLPLWTALPQWAASTTYTVGQIRRPLTAYQYDNKCAYVVTTGGTSGSSEPSWNTNNNGTVNDNGVIWTNVTGQSAYAWTAPAGSYATLDSGNDINYRVAGGDTVFIDSNSAETTVPNYSFNRTAASNLPVKVYSVNASGAVPPTNADYSPGASFDFNNAAFYVDTGYSYYGLIFQNISYSVMAPSGNDTIYFKDCKIIQGSSQNQVIYFDSYCRVILDNTQVIPYSGNTTNYLIAFNQTVVFEWWNTPNATNGYYVAVYAFSSSGAVWVHLKGVDISAFTTSNSPNGLINVNEAFQTRYTFENCYLGMPDYLFAQNQITVNDTVPQPIIEVINSYNGTENYNNSRFTSVGILQTETSTALNGGATDGLTSFSHKITTSSYAGTKDTFQTMDGFPIFFNNTVVGSAQVAEVQVIATKQLTSDDIRLELDFLSSSSYPQSQTVSTSPPLLTATDLDITTATWATLTNTAYVSYAATALQGNSYWTRTSDTLASFSGSSNACTVFVDNIAPFSPSYMEFQNQTFGSNQVAIGFIRSNYSSSLNDPRSNNTPGYMMLIENGNVYGNNGNGSYAYVGTTITSGDTVRVLWDGKGNMAFAINNGSWNNTYSDSAVLTSGGLITGYINNMPIVDIVPFIEVKGGSASSWKIAADSTNCIYSPPSGSNYLPVASNNYIPQKLSVSFTAQNNGLARALVRVTNPVTQIWYDPSVSLAT